MLARRRYGTGGGVKVVEPRFDAITKLMADIFKMVRCCRARLGDHNNMRNIVQDPSRDAPPDADQNALYAVLAQPVANVAFTGGDHAYIKSSAYGGNTVTRATSFCHWVLVPLYAEMLVVPDTRKDGRRGHIP